MFTAFDSRHDSQANFKQLPFICGRMFLLKITLVVVPHLPQTKYNSISFGRNQWKISFAFHLGLIVSFGDTLNAIT
jgi:hypothetical protein